MDDTRPWHQQFWPWFLITLPAVVVMACFYTVYLALHNPLSIVKEDYYKEGLAINQNQQLYRHAQALNIAARCLFAHEKVQCEFVSGGERLGDKPLKLQFMHPVNSDKDFDVSLHLLRDTVDGRDIFYVSDLLPPAQRENLSLEKRWYIYLESVGGDWALQTESAVQENIVIALGGVRG